MSKPFLKVTKDITKNFNGIIEALKHKEVLVGVPNAKTDREDDEEGPIGNAALMYINEFGSPAQNIPARQPMATGIRNAQDDIADQFKKCAKEVFSKGQSALDVYFNRAGFIASSSVKNTINNQIDMDPPSDATMKARKSKGFKGDKALVVTGQLRNSITYVVSSKGLLNRKKAG